jgi:hypothetical protein
MHGAPLPRPENEEELDDAWEDILEEMEPREEDDLEQAVRDVVFESEYRSGFRFYAVSPEDMRRLAALVDLDHLLDH